MNESYSYSKLNLFRQCQYQYKLKYIDKVETPFSDNAIFEKGRFIHYLIEHYPKEVEYKFKYPEVREKELVYRSFVKTLVKNTKRIEYLLRTDVLLQREQQFYLDREFNPVEGKAASTFNGVIDYVGAVDDSVLLVDWKTGKSQSASLDQLEFYSIWAFNKFPHITKVQCFLMYVEQDAFKHKTILRSELQEIQNKYIGLVETIESLKDFKKSRTNKCEYCAFQTECSKIKLKGK